MQKIISLGNNCEVSFQIERFIGKNIDSKLFSWAYTLIDEKFLCALENIDDVFMNGIHFHMPSDDMFYDEKYDITFHGRTSKELMFDHEGNIKNQPAYDECLRELKLRLRYLKEKTKQDFISSDDKIYLRKVEICPKPDGTFNYSRAIDFISRLNLILEQKVLNGTYKLVIVIEKQHLTPALQALQTDKLFLRTVDFFAPIYDTKNGADYQSWRKILLEFADKQLLAQLLSERDIRIEELNRSAISRESRESLHNQLQEQNQTIECQRNQLNILLNDKWIQTIIRLRKYNVGG